MACVLLDGEYDVRNVGSRTRGNTTIGGLYACPVDMVVMEHIEGDAAEKASALPKDVREGTKRAIQKLHDAQLVFGDLCGPIERSSFQGTKCFSSILTEQGGWTRRDTPENSRGT